MALNNGGTINNTSNPTGHSHSIHQITELSAGGITGDMLVYSNDIWIPHDATPYVVASGLVTQTLAVAIGASGKGGPYTVNFATLFGVDTKFTLAPIVTIAHSSTDAASSRFLILHVETATTTGFTWYAYNPMASASGTGSIIISFTAIQMFATTAGGMVSRDPSI